jgi:hypothetical protein
MFQASYALNQTTDNTDCLFYMAHCSIKQEKFPLAKKLLDAFLSSNKNPDLVKKAKLLLNGVIKKIESANKEESKEPESRKENKNTVGHK